MLTGHYKADQLKPSTEAVPSGRIEWVDIVKALGLISVVIGHNLHLSSFPYNASCTKYIYWFHMPLFFILSGILHKPDTSFWLFCKARFKHLMVPYYAFLGVFILLMLSGCFERVPIKKLLLGGLSLSGTPVALAWFVSCLFATQIAAFFILKLNNHKVLICALLSYFTAMMLQWRFSFFDWGCAVVFFVLPLSIEVVPMALTFYLIGYICKKRFLSGQFFSKTTIILFVCVPLMTVFFDQKGIIKLPFYSMAGQHYGLPVINVLMPVSCFFLVGYGALLISQWCVLRKILAAIGRAALPILFTHLLLPDFLLENMHRMTGLNLDCFISRVALGLLLPYMLYCLLNRFNVTRKFFLGL